MADWGEKVQEQENRTSFDAADSSAEKTSSVFKKYGFTGSYRHGLDAKGRLIIPVSFREALGKIFAVCESPDFKKIAIYPLAAWEKRLEDYARLLEENPEAQHFMSRFTKFSYPDSEMDAQGRLLLPSSLRAKYLADAKDIDLNGSYDHIVVEESVRSRREEDEFDARFPDPLHALAEMKKRSL